MYAVVRLNGGICTSWRGLQIQAGWWRLLQSIGCAHNGTHPMPILVPTHDRHEEREMFFLKHSKCLYAVLLNFSFRPSHPILSECHWNIEDESNGEGFTPGGQTEPTCAAHLWISSHQLYLLPLRIFPPKSAISERLGLVSHILGKKCPEKTFNFRHLFFKYKHRYRKSMCFANTKTKTEKRCRQI